jgi:hypothetical protein
MEWLKTRQLNFERTAFDSLQKIIGDIKLEAVKQQDQHMLLGIAQWILFMIVNILAWWPSIEVKENRNWAKSAAEIPNESFRMLFRFIALGLEGLNYEQNT